MDHWQVLQRPCGSSTERQDIGTLHHVGFAVFHWRLQRVLVETAETPSRWGEEEASGTAAGDLAECCFPLPLFSITGRCKMILFHANLHLHFS